MTAKMPSPIELRELRELENDVVRLTPLTLAHIPDLLAAGGGDEELWRWMPTAVPRTEQDLTKLAAKLIDGAEYLPFAVIPKESGRAVGWTTFGDVPTYDESIEIGWTWYGRSVWRSAVNTNCKILLLDHAFDTVGYNRVLLKTDHLNLRSQAAIRRIGGVYEGTLRRHRRRPDGTWRDSAHFSILAEEWPEHRARLSARASL